MTEAEEERVVRLSNARETELMVWLEPWCDEIILPPRAEVAMVVVGHGALPELVTFDSHITVYGAGNTRLDVQVNGVKQDTVSSEIVSPDTEALSTREFVDLVFGSFPETRPSGVPSPAPSLYRRLLGRLFSWTRR